MPLLDQEQIKKLIPHRDPFLFVDEITEMEPGERVTGVKHIAEDAYWFRGHFPEYPVTPGVLLVEMLTQTATICTGMMPEYEGKTPILAKINKARFVRPVLPGSTLTIKAEIIDKRSDRATCKATGYLDGKAAVQAESVCVFRD